MRTAAVGLCLLLAAACTGSGTSPDPEPSQRAEPSSAAAAQPSPAASEARAAAMELCPETPDAKPARGGSAVPAELRRIERFVEDARGLEFPKDVNMEAVTPARMKQLVRNEVSQPGLDAFLRRRGETWQAMGAIPPGADLAEAYRAFVTSQVIGFYDPTRDVLVFIGEDLDAFARFTLAHELVHAIEDQNFDLERLVALDSRCEEEAGLAARALAEGSATVYSMDVLRSFTPDELAELGEAALNLDVGIPSSVPDFLVALETWPYMGGMDFVNALRTKGNQELVDFAFETLPVTSEQIMHPNLYPDEVPRAVDVPDAAGPDGWATIDVGEAGEMWLKTWLDERGVSDAAQAAAGWDGGIYRAWRDPDTGAVAVVMETAWDSEEDAAEFASAAEGATAELEAEVHQEGDRVSLRFGSDDQALSAVSSHQ